MMLGTPGGKQGLGLALTVGRYPIGLCRRWVSCVGGSLLDSSTILCLAVGCHGRGWLAGQDTWARSAWKESRLNPQAQRSTHSTLFWYQHHHFPLNIYSLWGRELSCSSKPFHFPFSWAAGRLHFLSPLQSDLTT